MRRIITIALLLAACASTSLPAAPTTVPELLAEFAKVRAADRVPASGIASVPTVLAAAGVAHFIVENWARDGSGSPIPVWLLKPPSAGPDAPVMFVMHGVGRDADRYMAEWVEIATREGLIIIVPEFTRANFPGNLNYNFGAVFDAKGKLRPRDQWSYSAIDAIFDRVVAREQLAAKTYILFGHSAGAQFVHRFVLLGVGEKMARAVSANSGSYTWPMGPNRWPFGVSDLPQGVWNPQKALGAPMLIMQGTADNDPDYPSLPRQPEAMAQGPHRLARGKAFFAAVGEAAQQAGVAFNWSCALVPDVGHDNGGMAPYALKLLRAPSLPKGGDCRLMKKLKPE
jgi:poly(3-hydroxybutyrate) depolymerase